MTEKKATGKTTDRNVDVNVDQEGTSETTRDVTVTRETEVTVEVGGDRAAHPYAYQPETPPPPDYVDIDWTVDTGGDSPHPTEVSSEGYTVPHEPPAVEPPPEEKASTSAPSKKA